MVLDGALTGRPGGADGAIEVTVARSDPGAPRRFHVERFRPMLVLDLLVAIQQRHDPSLGFRYSCRIAACGTCAVRVDGVPVLACQSIVSDDQRAVTIEPLGGLPVVRDLVVDMTPFHERWARVGPAFVPASDVAGQAPLASSATERRAIDPNLDCITCGACYAACDMASSGVAFLGPAALNRAMTLVADSRDGDRLERLAMVSGDDGIDGCHGIGACTEVCPKGLDPSGSIRRLRRMRLGLPA